MSDLEEQIKSSVGWVLSSSESTTFAGNAFLFRQNGDHQYWFTCHHVIMDLPELFICAELNHAPVTASYVKEKSRPASYVEEKSRPERDIAVLRTSERDWANLMPLHMGDPFLTRKDTPDNYRLFLFGYARDKNSDLIKPRLIRSPFNRHDHDAYYLQARKSQPAKAKSDQKIDREWHIQVDGPLDIATYELHEGHHLLPGLSGAPVCYLTTDDDVACLGMFTQIWRGRSGDVQKGVAIKYIDLMSSAGSLIPLYPYADCLVVTIAATRDEIIAARRSHSEEEADWWLHLAQEYFYDNHRDHWKPFGEGKEVRSVVDLLGKSGISAACQLISDYAGEADEILRLITNFSGVLFILDPCSTKIESLRRIIEIANQTRWKASYLVACCEQRVAGRWGPAVIASTVNTELREVTADPLCIERMESAWRVEEFIKHFGRLVDSTIKIGLATWSANPLVKARLERILKGAGNAAKEIDSFPQRKPGF